MTRRTAQTIRNNITAPDLKGSIIQLKYESAAMSSITLRSPTEKVVTSSMKNKTVTSTTELFSFRIFDPDVSTIPIKAMRKFIRRTNRILVYIKTANICSTSSLFSSSRLSCFLHGSILPRTLHKKNFKLLEKDKFFCD